MDPIFTPLIATGVSTLLPSLANGLGRLIDRVSGGAKPANVEEEVKLIDAHTNRIRAIAEIDRPDGAASQWVVNFRQSFRYFAASFILVLFAAVSVTALFTTVQEWVVWNVFSMAGIVVGWLFGERFILKAPNPVAPAARVAAPAPLVPGNPASGGR